MSNKSTTFEMRSIEDLIPYARNARTHNSEQVNKLAGSIKEFGFINPVIISEDGGILAGHGRVMAAKKLGLTEVPCVVETHLSPAQKKAYILADNRLALDAGWDEEMLKIELDELRELNFDMDLMGFSDEELNKLTDISGDDSVLSDSEDEESEIEVDETADSVTEVGDVWIMGNHRLICGDCTDPEVVSKLLGDDKPNLMVTDPPYGIKYDPSTHANSAKSGKRLGSVQNDDIDDWSAAYKLFPGNVAYVWHGAFKTDVFMKSMKDCGFEITSVIIWNKNMPSLTWNDYRIKHEPCLYCTKGNHNFKGDRSQFTVWDIPNINCLKEEGSWGHSTQKPIECMRRPIVNNSDEGDFVYEPFSGSGTTFIAAERTNRKCLGCEISPQYCDVIVRRWQLETGKKAYLQKDGTLFDDIEKGVDE